MALTSPPPIPQRGDPATFSDRVDAFLTWEGNTLVPQLNTLEANLSSIAFGGAYAIPFRFYFDPTSVGGSAGNIAAGSPGVALNATANLMFDQVDTAGYPIKSRLDSLFLIGNSSTIKGHIKLTKQGDTSKWVLYQVTTWSFVPGAYPYGFLTLSCVGYSAANPFADGEAIVMQCQRTGDMGPMGTYPITLLRDVRANGVQAQTMGVGWNRRVLNTLAYNGITGALLNNYAPNTFSLPAGTYLIEVSASAYGTQGHMLRLVNAANGAVVDTGTSELSSTAGNNPTIVTKALLRSVVTVTGSGLALAIDHFSNQSGGSGGYPAGSASGATEMYAEIKITKIAS